MRQRSPLAVEILSPDAECWHLTGIEDTFEDSEEAQFRLDIALYGGYLRRRNRRGIMVPSNPSPAFATLMEITREYESEMTLPEVMEFLLEKWRQMDAPVEQSFRELVADFLRSFDMDFFDSWDHMELMLAGKWD